MTDKQKLVAKEKRRLNKVFESIDENKKIFVQHQIDNLAWLNVSVVELKANIDEFGTMVTYDNGGGQTGVKDNPDVKTLIAYQKNVIAITKQLVDLVPTSQKKSKLELLFND